MLQGKETEITVGQGGYISGTVLDADGQPAPGVPLRVKAPVPNHGLVYGIRGGTTDDRGASRLGPLPDGGRFRIDVGAEFRQRVTEGARQEVSISPDADVPLQPIVVDLRGATLRGTVLTEDLQPVAGAMVGISGASAPYATDENGAFEATGLPVLARLWVAAIHPTQPLAAAEQVDPEWGYEPGLVLRPLATAQARILTAAGGPLAGATVRLSPRLPVMRGTARSSSSSGGARSSSSKLWRTGGAAAPRGGDEGKGEPWWGVVLRAAPG